MASQLYSIRLTREDTSIPWGFRLEGGIDFGHPMNIQHVNPGSIADYSGLRSGDQVIRINQSETKWMRHNDAKMEIIRSNNNLELFVQRDDEIINSFVNSNNIYTSSPVHSMSRSPKPISPQSVNQQTSIWKPKIVSSVHNDQSGFATHTSLEATPANTDLSIGLKHNVSPLPFGQSPPAPGENLITKVADGRYRKISHSSYNSPMGLYNQKNRNQTFERTLSNASGTGNQSIGQPSEISTPTPASPPSMYCGSCGGFIRGVFIKVQGRVPMHPECLKCCKCGIGLRNIGYFYIKEQLYCETHAKQAAPPPQPGMKAVVVYK